MIPVGYLAKRVALKPDWLNADQVKDIYSVSCCVSDAFCEYIQFWRHNGYWLFDSPEVIYSLAKEEGIDLADTTMFYYEAYEYQYDEEVLEWSLFEPEASFDTDVKIPRQRCCRVLILSLFIWSNRQSVPTYPATIWRKIWRSMRIAC
ncbi:hypothetical protein [Pectobacterium carotovorum]|uniref:hypothetical protein n=1 Tax=Pectobacterium carotovorum TaxID=554 RepID=UPI001F18A792|nr:hypothetical protein [Pectobacterium carotovorum]